MQQIIPWTATAYDALRGTHLRIGIGVAVSLIVIFILGRLAIDGPQVASLGDARLAIIHILFAAYTATAYAYLVSSASNSAHDLIPVLGDATQWQSIVDSVGKYPWWALVFAGVTMNLAVVPITIQTTVADINPWDWQALTYDVRWHRVMAVLFNWWNGCFLYVLVVESARLSRLSESIESVDLTDLRPYQPLIRQGLTNALLIIGMASVLSLFLVEPGYAVLLAGVWSSVVFLAWVGLMRPLRGIRKKIGIAKDRELDWCQQALRIARDNLKSGNSGQQSITEIIAYQSTIENVRNWPFDNPTLVRFALYLLIPLGSWLGGAFVERGLDLFLG